MICIKTIYSFNFKNNFIKDNKVCIKFMFQYRIFIFYTVFLFSFIRNVIFNKFIFYSVFVHNFRKPFSQLSMYFHCYSNYFVSVFLMRILINIELTH